MGTYISKKSFQAVLYEVVISLIATGVLGFGALFSEHRIWFFIAGGILIYLISIGLSYNYAMWKSKQEFERRTFLHHAAIHDLRDQLVKQMLPKRTEIPIAKPGKIPVALTGPLDNIGEIQNVMNSYVGMFQEMAPGGVKVWACLRERRNDDHYHTAIRARNYHRGRGHKSQSLHKESETIKSLKQSFDITKTCVYITGAGKPGWKKQENDALGEDKSVMMGAVLSKSWNGASFDKTKLNWVLYVNADHEDVFDQSYVNLMKCFNDTLACILNQLIRTNYLKYTFNPETNTFERIVKFKMRRSA